MNKNENQVFLPRWLLFIAWGALIVWLSLISAPPIVNAPLFGWDKLQHGIAYAFLTFLAFLAMAGSVPAPLRRARIATFFAIFLGALIEVAQRLFTTTRVADIGDLLADAIGALFVYGLLIWRQWIKRS